MGHQWSHPFPKYQWLALVEEYGKKCLSCGNARKKLTVDHAISLADGGVDEISNIQPLCKGCNSRKRGGSVDYRPYPVPTRIVRMESPNQAGGRPKELEGAILRSFTLARAEYDFVASEAKKNNVSMSEVVRSAIRESMTR